MRIVILYLGKRGAGPMYSYEFTKALLDKNIQIYAIISSHSENIHLWKELKSNYNNFELTIITTYLNIGQFVLNTLNFNKFYNIAKQIIDFNPKYVFTPMVHPWHNIIICLLPSRIKRIKVIHDVFTHLGERNIFSNLLSWVDIKKSDILIVLSEHSKSQLVNRIGKKKRIIVIPHANFNVYNQISNQPLSKQELHNRIGFIGRISKYKGLDILLDAFHVILEERSQERLLIAGNGDCSEYKEKIEKLKKSLDLQIRWIPDDEIASLVSCVDIIVLPYIEASQSGIIPLAFSLGKPVVATNVGGIPEQVPPKTGIIIPPNSSEAITKAVLELYNDPNRIFEMGNKAKLYALENLTWEASANIFLKHIN